mgnify:CR=1 FL=1
MRISRFVMNAGAKIIVSDTDRDVKKSDGSFNDFPSKIKWWVKRINIQKRFKVRFAARCSTKTIINVASEKFGFRAGVLFKNKYWRTISAISAWKANSLKENLKSLNCSKIKDWFPKRSGRFMDIKIYEKQVVKVRVSAIR